METPKPLFRTVKDLSGLFGFTIEETDGALFVNTSESRLICLRFSLEPNSDSAFMLGLVASRGYHCHGDRTGFATLIGTLWSLALRADSTSSVALVVGSDFVEGEYPSSYLWFEQLGQGSLNVNEPNVGLLASIFSSTLKAAKILDAVLADNDFINSEELFWQNDANGFREEQWHQADEWADAVAHSSGVASAKRSRGYTHGLHLFHYVDVNQGIKILRFNNIVYGRLCRDLAKSNPKTLIGVSGDLFITDVIRNCIPHDRITLAQKLMKTLHLTESNKTTRLPWLLLPLESELNLVCPHGIVSVAGSCGLGAFLQEKELVRERRKTEAEVLFPQNHFQWAAKVNDDRFEQLIYELLKVEPNVIRVKRIGNSRSPDGGRDLHADWFLAPKGSTLNRLNVESAREHNDNEIRPPNRVVIQCKAFSKAIDKSKVTDIRDTVEHHNSNGYLLVAYPSITAPLVSHLDQLQLRGDFWVDWWCKDEIEDRLDRHPEIMRRFGDLVVAVEN